MLSGKYPVKVDDAGRLTVPVRHRDVLGDEVVVTRSFPPHRQLMLFGQAAFDQWIRSHFPPPTVKPDELLLKRLIMSNAFTIKLDTAGRILVPKDLRELAGITKEVMVVGMVDYCEIWDPKDFERWDLVANSPEMIGRAEATLLGLRTVPYQVAETGGQA